MKVHISHLPRAHDQKPHSHIYACVPAMKYANPATAAQFSFNDPPLTPASRLAMLAAVDACGRCTAHMTFSTLTDPPIRTHTQSPHLPRCAHTQSSLPSPS